jgi:hypothetical protein
MTRFYCPFFRGKPSLAFQFGKVDNSEKPYRA